METKVPLLSEETQPRTKTRKYLEGGFFNRYLLMWVTSLVDIGNKEIFQQNMHWELRKSEDSAELVNKLKTAWHSSKKPTLFSLLTKIHSKLFFWSLLLSVFASLFQYTGPLFLYLIIHYVEDPNQNINYGILLVSGIVVSRICQAILYSQSNIYVETLGINFKNSINSIVYDKLMRFSLMRSIDHSTGSLINHIQVDSEKIYNLAMAIGGSIILPLQIGVGIFMMCEVIGWAFWSGLGVIILMGGVNFLIGKRFYVYQQAIMERKDDRMKISNEIMSGIKYIKMSGWESIFLKRVCDARDKELSYLKKQYLTTCFSIFSLWLTPMLVTTAIFGTYVFTGHELTPVEAFTVLSIYQ